VPTFRDNLRSLPKPVWILFGGTFINRFGSFVMPFLVLYMTKQGYTPARAGICVSAYGLGHLVASATGGYLADHIGRRHTIVLSMFGSATAMIALSQARAYPAILVMTFVVAAFSELYRPAASALITDLVTPEQRITAFGVYRWAINLGFAFGPATAGFLADRSFLYLFLGDAATSFVYGIVALTALPHGLRGQTNDQSPTEGIRVALRDKVFVRFLLGTLCISWIEFQAHSTLPLYVTASGYTATDYGMLMSINGVLIVVFELAITAWTQRMPQQPVIALGYMLAGLGFALTGFAHGLPALGATVVVWTLGEMIFAPVTGAFVSGLAPERYRGRYMGLWVMSWSVGMLLGPTLGTLVYQRQPALLWASCALMGCVGALLTMSKPRAR
jgi:MFS family permease